MHSGPGPQPLPDQILTLPHLPGQCHEIGQTRPQPPDRGLLRIAGRNRGGP